MIDLKRIFVDLKRSLDCLKIIQQEGHYRKYRIGCVVKEALGLVDNYDVGSVILFYKSEYDSSLIIESAMTKEEIERQKQDNSGLRTIRTMVGVPKSHVQDLSYLFPTNV